jgi:hypothetical protein
MPGTAKETFVQVATDGSGKQIRNLAIDVIQSDGTVATVYVQAAAIYDRDGRAVDLNAIDQTNRLLSAVLVELKQIRRFHAAQLGVFAPDTTDASDTSQ